jgi:hypothetical protein
LRKNTIRPHRKKERQKKKQRERERERERERLKRDFHRVFLCVIF